MHYDRHYTGDQADNDKAAIQDIIEYLGKRKFLILCEEFRKDVQVNGIMPFGRFEIFTSIAGIQGYPVRAWARYLGATVIKQPE